MRTAGEHRSGVVISGTPLDEFAPMRLGYGTKGWLDLDEALLGELGLFRLDVSPSRNATVIGASAAMVRRSKPHFRHRDIPLDDEKALRLLSAGEVLGADGRDLLPSRPVRSVADLIAALEDRQPAPLENGHRKPRAAAAAVTAYWLAWLKAHHPVEFMAAVLSHPPVIHSPGMRNLMCAESRRLGIEVLPPRVNQSAVRFLPERAPDGLPAIPRRTGWDHGMPFRRRAAACEAALLE